MNKLNDFQKKWIMEYEKLIDRFEAIEIEVRLNKNPWGILTGKLKKYLRQQGEILNKMNKLNRVMEIYSALEE